MIELANADFQKAGRSMRLEDHWATQRAPKESLEGDPATAMCVRNFVLEIQGRLVTEGARVASGLEVTLDEFGELAIKSCRMRG